LAIAIGGARRTKANAMTVRVKNLSRIRRTLLLAILKDKRHGGFLAGISPECYCGYFEGDGDFGGLVGKPVAALGLGDGLWEAFVFEALTTPSSCKMKANPISATPIRVATRSISRSKDPRMTL
jgi:hypothetical protein